MLRFSENYPEFEGFEISAPLARNQQFERADFSRNRAYSNFTETLAFGAPATVAAAIDTVAQTFGLMDEGEMAQTLSKLSPNLGAFYDENEDTVKFVGDVAGSFLPATLGFKAVRTGSWFHRAASNVFGEERITPFFSTGLNNAKLWERYQEQAEVLARTTTTALDKYPEFRTLRRRAVGRSVADTVIEAVAADAAVVASMNASEVLFPDDYRLIDHLVFFGGVNALIGGGAFAIAKHSFNRWAQETLGPIAASVQNPSGLPIGEAYTRMAGNRGPAISTFNLARHESIQRGAAAREAGNMTEVAELNNHRIAYEDASAKQYMAAGRDNPIDGVTRRYRIGEDSPAIRTLHGVSRQEPTWAMGLSSLEEFTEGAADLTERRLQSKIIKGRAELKVLAEERQGLMKALREAGEGRKEELRKRNKSLGDKMYKLNKQVQDWEKHTTIVAEIDETLSTAVGRPDIYQDGARKVIKLPGGDNLVKVGDMSFLSSADGSLKIPAGAPVENRFLPKMEKESLAMAELKLDPIKMAKGVGASSLSDLRTRLRSVGTFELKATDDVTRLRSVFDDSDVIVGYVKNHGDSELSLTKTRAYDKPVVTEKEKIWGLTGDGHLLVDVPFGKAGKVAPTQVVNPVQFASMNLIERTGAMDAMQAAAEAVDPATWKGMTLPAQAHWTQLDFVQRLVKQHGDVVTGKIDGFTTLDDIEYRSLQSKAQEYQMLRKLAADAIAKDETHWASSVEGLARGLNLPPNPRHPIYKLLETLVTPTDELLPLSHRVRNMDEIKTALKQEALIDEQQLMGPGFSLTGPMMNLARDRKPVVAVIQNQAESTAGITKDQLMEKAISVRAEALRRMEKFGGEITRSVLAEVKNNPEAVASVKNNLPEIIQGIQNSGLVASQIVQQSFRLRGTPGFPALNLLTDLMDKAGKQGIERLLKDKPETLGGKSVQQAFNELMEFQNEGHLMSFNTGANAFRSGWNVKEASPVLRNVEGGKQEIHWQYILADDTQNRQVWARQFPDRPFPEGDEILMPSAFDAEVPVTLTSLAHDNVEALSYLSNKLLDEINGHRITQGLKVLPRKRYHLPPRNLSGTHVTYLVDNAGQVKSAVSAGTAQSSRRLAEKEIENSQIPLTIVDQSTMQLRFEARGQAFFELDDFSNPKKQTGPAKGTSVGVTVGRGKAEFREMTESTLRHLNDVAREARLLFFDPELQFLRRQANAAGVVKRKDQTVYDLMVNTLLGTQNLTTASIPGRFLLATESVYDQLMQRVFDKIPGSAGGGWLAQADAKTTYDEFVKKNAPEFNPFHDFNDFLQKTAKVTLPRELRKDAGVMNEITTALAIRMFDIGMGVINVLSLATTLPPVVKMLQRLPGEAEAKHLERIAAFGAATPKGIGYFSPTRAAISGIHFFFSPEGRRVAQMARDKGFFDQYAAEQVEIFARTGEGYIGGLLRSFADKVSPITDKTERLARAVSWMTFYNVGKKGLGLKDEGAMAFAHAQANNVIADFRPSNRPVIFQGAAGMPLGLFTTFMWNYLQRVYGLVENANIGGLVNQVGLQATLFGAESVPGVPEFIDIFTSNYDGSENLVDRLHKAFGQDVTSGFLNGSIASLSGISIGPRAAVGLPFQSGISAQAVAGFRMAGRAVSAVHQNVQHTLESRVFDPGMAAEILARSNINKGVSNAIELIQGYSTDTAGNLIEADTQEWIGVASRMAGLKPLYADELRQENRRNQATDRIRNGMKKRLGQRLQSAYRQGELGPEEVDDAIARYMMAGGNPENFKRFFTGQVMKASQSKVDLEIAKALKKSADDSRLARLLFLSE